MWIQGIARANHGFALQTVSPSDNSLQPLHRLSAKLPGKTKRKRITTDCRTWQRDSAAPFWDYLGVRPELANHTVFELEDENQRYLIPASVFIAGVIRPIKTIHAFLFQPQGLDLMCLPLFNKEKPSVGFYEPEYLVLGGPAARCESVLAGLSWMHCFPSARTMWDSVLGGALLGKLDVSLPAATMTLVLHSVDHGDYKLVTGITLIALRANEMPFSFAATHATEICFHDSTDVDWTTAHNPKCALLSRDGEWHFSDEEWAKAVELLPKTGSNSRYDRRKILDMALLKTGTGQPWRKLDYQDLNFNIVQATYRSLTKSGHWQLIENLINGMRTRPTPSQDSKAG